MAMQRPPGRTTRMTSLIAAARRDGVDGAKHIAQHDGVEGAGLERQRRERRREALDERALLLDRRRRGGSLRRPTRRAGTRAR